MKSAHEAGDECVVWGHNFRWTSEHLSKEDIQHLLFSSDKLAVEALDRIDEISPPTSKHWKCPHGSGKGQRDLYALLEEHSEADQVLGKLWREVTTVPDWVDWEQIKRGQRVVYQFNGQIILGLLFGSLLGGMSAWRIVETLSRTGGFGVNVTRRRLLETFQHFLEVSEDLAAVKPGGKGFVSTVRVRLLHASVRRRLMQLERERPGYFDMEKWGVPINDLHCILTVNAYSTALVHQFLPRQGIFLSEEQTADYLALWRWIGYLLGTPVDWMSTPSQAKAMGESIITFEMNPSPNSCIIANNILTALSHVPPMYASREYLAAMVYQLNGEELGSALNIRRPHPYHHSLAWTQCYAFRCMSHAYPWLPTVLQKQRDKKFLSFGYELITSQKMGGTGEVTKYEFQYLPDFGKMTALEPLVKAEATNSKQIVLLVMGILMSFVAVALISLKTNPWLHSVAQRMGSVVLQEHMLERLL